MGCDIHFVVEYKPHKDLEWVGVYSSGFTPRVRTKGEDDHPLTTQEPLHEAYYRGASVATRHYAFFNALAGVRGSGPATPKGAPNDLSSLAKMNIAYWDGDGHSHSWDTLDDFCMKWALVSGDAKMVRIATVYMIGEATEQETESIRDHLFGDYLSEGQYRVIYWFDN